MRFTLFCIECAKVAQRHGERGGNPDQPEPFSRLGGKKHAQEHGKRRCLGAGGHQGYIGRRRTFVHVGRPDMEGSRSHFKAESNDHQRRRANGQQVWIANGQRCLDVGNAGGPGCAEHQSNAIKEERRGK